MRVSVIGCGAIGGVVARALAAGEVAGAELVGVVHGDETDPVDLPVHDTESAVREADLVVECAGQRALRSLVPLVSKTGGDLLITSVGALADDELFSAVIGMPDGRVYLASGAIGGLDMLSAARRMGPLRTVRLVTTKTAGNLVQPWMDHGEAQRLRSATGPVELLRGPARTVTAAFPKSTNVAASVALAVGSWDAVEAVVVGDPHATRTSHVITAEGPAGAYRFEITNQPSEQTPTSSGVVPFAVLRAIETLAGAQAVFV